ncbi:ABC transporter permease, partial [Streptomyces griseomycini]
MTQPATTAQKEAPTSAAESAADKESSRRPLGLRWDVRSLSLLGVLAVLVAVGGITAPDEFLATSNLQLVLTQASVIGVVTVGMTFVIVSGGIDLS